MQSESIIRPAANGQDAGSVAAAQDALADFSTDRRVLLLSVMALAIGAIGSVVADALIWLIAALTNLAFYHRLSAIPQAGTETSSPGSVHTLVERSRCAGWTI